MKLIFVRISTDRLHRCTDFCRTGLSRHWTEHAWSHDTGRASYVPVTDEEAVEAFEYLARTEGIICAIESAHAVAHARKLAPTLSSDQSIIICLSGRGDKDVAAIARYRGEDISE